MEMQRDLDQQENNRLTEKVAQLEERIHVAEAKNCDLVARNGVLTKQEQDRALELKVVEQDLSELRARAKGGDDALEDLRSTKDQMAAQMNQMITENANLQAEKNKLSEALKTYRKELEMAGTDRTELEQQLQKLQADYKLEEERLRKRQSEINSLLAENRKYKGEVDEVRQRFGDLSAIEEKLKLCELKEAKIVDLLEALDTNMASTENQLSCYSCSNLLTEATVLVSCGHVLCKDCCQTNGKTCKQCQKQVKGYLENALISDLAAKFTINKDAIETFKKEDFWKK